MRKVLGTLAIGALAATAAIAEDVAPAAVVFTEYGEVEASLTGVPGDAARGAETMIARGKGNCLACHQITALDYAPFHGEVGPSLDGAGDRWTEAQLRGLVTNAKKTFDGTIMPAFYKTSGYIRPGDAFTGKAAKDPELPPLLTAQEIEDVVAFLATLKE